MNCNILFSNNLSKKLLILIVFYFSSALMFPQEKHSAAHGGLLFYLSGSRDFTADYAAGRSNPNFLYDVKVIKDGAKGVGFHCEGDQLLSYWAPGNIYSERGTLSFFWRARDPLGKTAFPVFRVSFADNSAWDMTWLRIDYNGGGFDAFVTDVNLARIRVSYKIPELPSPSKWLHFALTWDETAGIRFYLNGKLIGEKDTADIFYTGLDQFGPHSRIISPYNVQSRYNYVRGGDIDEIRIYDHALPQKDITLLAAGESPDVPQFAERDLSESNWAKEWAMRYGWNNPQNIPPYMDKENMTIRKVEIDSAFDLKRWVWKANDGIKETTWPGVYNRSRILGRNDYFQLPDWDCYSLSGKSIRFNMPEEPWNYLEIWGGAYGTVSLSGQTSGADSSLLFSKPEGEQRTFYKLNSEVTGHTIVFTNKVQETPMGEFNAFNIEAGNPPEGYAALDYQITSASEPDNGNLTQIKQYISGRYTPDERTIMLALPEGAPRVETEAPVENALPIVHIIIPSGFRNVIKPEGGHSYSYTWDNIEAGLDGILIELPPLKVKPSMAEYFPLNIQVKDPICPLRDMFDFSFSVKPNEAKNLWLDLRDRILPKDKPLYLTLAASGPDFIPSMLEGAKIRLIFKQRKDALKEHIADRWNQVRDNYGFIVEEHPNDRRFTKFDRFENDITDLLRVDPENKLAREYWSLANPEQPLSPFTQPVCPKGIPLWAFRQVKDLAGYKKLVEWYIDNRQISNGELGGGLSDDSDLGNSWPGLAFMGCIPDKVAASSARLMEAIYKNGMMTDGLNTIQTDGLHAYEEGTNVLGQVNLLDFGNPKEVERMMQNCRALEAKVIGKNEAGHYHFRSNYYGAKAVAQEGVWLWCSDPEYLILQPAIYLGQFYGNPAARKLVINMADGLLAHARKTSDGKTIIDLQINYNTDESRPSPLCHLPLHELGFDAYSNAGINVPAIYLFWAAWRWTGDEKYLKPLLDVGPKILGLITNDALDLINLRDSFGKDILDMEHKYNYDLLKHFAWQLTGNKKFLEDYYADQIRGDALREYYNTEGSPWIDRVYVAERELQRSRLGGVALSRNEIFPGNAVSWKFKSPASGESAGILIKSATTSGLNIEVFNLDNRTVYASMTGWDVLPGKWKVEEKMDSDGDGNPDTELNSREVKFGLSDTVDFAFPPRKGVFINLKLLKESTDYSNLPDLAVGKEDIKINGNKVEVVVHNLGSAKSKPALIVLRNSDGKVIAESDLPSISAPVDLYPKTKEIILSIPGGTGMESLSVQIDPKNSLDEITKRNNTVKITN
jgi:hypothetical protein